MMLTKSNLDGQKHLYLIDDLVVSTVDWFVSEIKSEPRMNSIVTLSVLFFHLWLGDTNL